MMLVLQIKPQGRSTLAPILNWWVMSRPSRPASAALPAHQSEARGGRRRKDAPHLCPHRDYRRAHSALGAPEDEPGSAGRRADGAIHRRTWGSHWLPATTLFACHPELTSRNFPSRAVFLPSETRSADRWFGLSTPSKPASRAAGQPLN